MSRITRHFSIVLSLTILTLGILAAPAAAAPEDSFVSKINASRAANGLAPLEVYWDLADDAEAHSKVMKAESDLHHNPELAHVTSGWSALAENVGVGPDVPRLHDAFMESSGHRKNILGNYNYVGVGVVRESETKIWVTVVFMRGPEGLVSPPAEDPPPAPAPEPVPPTPEPEPVPPTDQPPAPRPAPSPPQMTAAQPEPQPVRVPVKLMGHPPGMRPIAI